MTFIVAGAPTTGASNSVKSAVVPDGVVVANHGLYVATGSSGGTPVTPNSCTFSGPAGSTFTQLIAPIQINNSWVSVWKGTGVKAGDTVTMTLNSNYLGYFAHTYWTTDPGVAVGSVFNRSGASRADCVAPAIAGAAAGDKFIVIGTERTTADGTAVTSRVNSAGNAVSGRYYYEEPTSSDSSVDVSEFTAAAAGSTGTVTITYSGGSGNGSAVMLKQGTDAPVTPPTPTVDFLWPNSFEAAAVRAGFIVTNGTTARLAVSTAATMAAPVYSGAVSVADGAWHTARVTGLAAGTQHYVQIEVDGVLRGDIMAARTLNPGAPLSFTFLTGSCQDTGSNHSVFDRMALEPAAFLVHQGDLHYADTSVAATWRAAFLSSMNAPKFKAMRAKWVMDYGYDNHDWAGQGQESDDWTGTDPTDMVREFAGEYPLAGNLFKTWVHGRVRFIHTDVWAERDPDEAAESSSKRAMSQAQEDLFLATLAAAEEPVIVWFTHWPLYTNLANGRWGSYTTQRNRIRAWLDARPGIRERIVGIGGDSHSVSADSGENQTPFGLIPTLNASPFGKTGSTTPSGTWDIVNYDVPDANGVYSRVTITDPGHRITLLWEAVNDAGVVVSTASWSRACATPTYWNGVTERPAVAYVWDGVRERMVTEFERVT